MTALGKGRDYDLLPETYVAFICTGDFLGTKLPISTLDICCREALDFDCRHGFRWVILDASKWSSLEPGPLQRLLQFVDTGKLPQAHYAIYSHLWTLAALQETTNSST